MNKLRDLTERDIGEFINMLYMCELHFTMNNFWDAGKSCSIQKNYPEDKTNIFGHNDLSVDGGVQELMTKLRDYIIEMCIDSSFTQWCKINYEVKE